MKITSEDFTKLRGRNGERFTSEAEWRKPLIGEWFINNGGNVQNRLCEIDQYGHRMILTRAKTAREWLLELPDGWREEALGQADEVHCESLRHAIMECIPPWGQLPSGWDQWNAVRNAIVSGTPIPPHPSKAKPKVDRLEVTRLADGLVGGSLPIQDWLGRADFRGFVYDVFGSLPVRGFAIGWIDTDGVLHDQPMGSHCRPVRPSFVEVER